MTLDEAKKKIEELGNDAWNKWKKEGNLISQGYALGMDDALGIVDKLEHEPVGNSCKLNLDDVIRNLESEEAVCRSHSEDDYYRGMADGYKLSIDALKGLSGNHDKMTLKELAQELRKIFPFKFLTYDYEENCLRTIKLWLNKPVFKDGNYIGVCVNCFYAKNLAVALDLSEYADESGEIDYSRCIVEVSDDIN